jgi:hypothetical protein
LKKKAASEINQLVRPLKDHAGFWNHPEKVEPRKGRRVALLVLSLGMGFATLKILQRRRTAKSLDAKSKATEGIVEESQSDPAPTSVDATGDAADEPHQNGVKPASPKKAPSNR